MPITLETIEDILLEVARFKQIAEEAHERLFEDADDTLHITGCKETAALRRASMDLSRALAELRKPWQGRNNTV